MEWTRDESIRNIMGHQGASRGIKGHIISSYDNVYAYAKARLYLLVYECAVLGEAVLEAEDEVPTRHKERRSTWPKSTVIKSTNLSAYHICMPYCIYTISPPSKTSYPIHPPIHPSTFPTFSTLVQKLPPNDTLKTQKKKLKPASQRSR